MQAWERRGAAAEDRGGHAQHRFVDDRAAQQPAGGAETLPDKPRMAAPKGGALLRGPRQQTRGRQWSPETNNQLSINSVI